MAQVDTGWSGSVSSNSSVQGSSGAEEARRAAKEAQEAAARALRELMAAIAAAKRAEEQAKTQAELAKAQADLAAAQQAAQKALTAAKVAMDAVMDVSPGAAASMRPVVQDLTNALQSASTESANLTQAMAAFKTGVDYSLLAGGNVPVGSGGLPLATGVEPTAVDLASLPPEVQAEIAAIDQQISVTKAMMAAASGPSEYEGLRDDLRQLEADRATLISQATNPASVAATADGVVPTADGQVSPTDLAGQIAAKQAEVAQLQASGASASEIRAAQNQLISLQLVEQGYGGLGTVVTNLGGDLSSLQPQQLTDLGDSYLQFLQQPSEQATVDFMRQMALTLTSAKRQELETLLKDPQAALEELAPAIAQAAGYSELAGAAALVTQSQQNGIDGIPYEVATMWETECLISGVDRFANSSIGGKTFSEWQQAIYTSPQAWADFKAAFHATEYAPDTPEAQFVQAMDTMYASGALGQQYFAGDGHFSTTTPQDVQLIAAQGLQQTILENPELTLFTPEQINEMGSTLVPSSAAFTVSLQTSLDASYNPVFSTTPAITVPVPPRSSINVLDGGTGGTYFANMAGNNAEAIAQFVEFGNETAKALAQNEVKLQPGGSTGLFGTVDGDLQLKDFLPLAAAIESLVPDAELTVALLYGEGYALEALSLTADPELAEPGEYNLNQGIANAEQQLKNEEWLKIGATVVTFAGTVALLASGPLGWGALATMTAIGAGAVGSAGLLYADSLSLQQKWRVGGLDVASLSLSGVDNPGVLDYVAPALDALGVVLSTVEFVTLASKFKVLTALESVAKADDANALAALAKFKSDTGLLQGVELTQENAQSAMNLLKQIKANPALSKTLSPEMIDGLVRARIGSLANLDWSTSKTLMEAADLLKSAKNLKEPALVEQYLRVGMTVLPELEKSGLAITAQHRALTAAMVQLFGDLPPNALDSMVKLQLQTVGSELTPEVLQSVAQNLQRLRATYDASKSGSVGVVDATGLPLQLSIGVSYLPGGAVSAEELQATIAALANHPIMGANGVPTTVEQMLVSLNLAPAEQQQLLQSIAVSRKMIQTIGGNSPWTTGAMYHLEDELARLIQIAKVEGGGAVDGQQIFREMLASVFSDAAKGKMGLDTLLRHHLDALPVMEQYLTAAGLESEIPAVRELILAHQVSPPTFMSNMFGVLAKSKITTVTIEGPNGAIDVASTVSGIQAKLADPLKSAVNGQIPFSAEEKAVIKAMGLGEDFAWYVPTTPQAAQVVAADSLSNYPFPFKIPGFRTPGASNFADPTWDAAIASCYEGQGSTVDSLKLIKDMEARGLLSPGTSELYMKTWSAARNEIAASKVEMTQQLLTDLTDTSTTYGQYAAQKWPQLFQGGQYVGTADDAQRMVSELPYWSTALQYKPGVFPPQPVNAADAALAKQIIQDMQRLMGDRLPNL